MSEYAEFRERVYRSLPRSNLELAEPSALEKIKSEFPGLPNEYLDFLSQVGHGTFDQMGFSIYGGPLDPDEIFDEITAKELSNYIFIGDDYSGWMLAYDISKVPFELTFFNHNEKVPFDEDKEPKTVMEFLTNELFPEI